VSKIIIKTKAKVWKAITTTMLTVSDEMPLIITPNAIKSVVMDPSHVSLVKLVCKKEFFETLQVEEPTEIVIHLSVLNNLVKRFEDEEWLTFTIDPKDQTLIIHPESSEKEFDLRTIDRDIVKTTEMPKIDYDIETEITISQLKEMIDDCKVVEAASAWLTTKNGKLKFEGRDDLGTATGVLLEGITAKLENTSYVFEYLGPFLNSIEKFVDTKITMQLASQKPLNLVAQLAEIGTVQFYLAPKSL